MELQHAIQAKRCKATNVQGPGHDWLTQAPPLLIKRNLVTKKFTIVWWDHCTKVSTFIIRSSNHNTPGRYLEAYRSRRSSCSWTVYFVVLVFVSSFILRATAAAAEGVSPPSPRPKSEWRTVAHALPTPTSRKCRLTPAPAPKMEALLREKARARKERTRNRAATRAPALAQGHGAASRTPANLTGLSWPSLHHPPSRPRQARSSKVRLGFIAHR